MTGMTHMEAERTVLYRFYDTAGELLYVGISKDHEKRWRGHSGKEWWPAVKRQTMDWHDSAPEALAAEEAAIKNEKPKYNVVHGTFPRRRSEPAPKPAPEEEVNALQATAWGRRDWEPTPEQEAEIERMVSGGLPRWAVRIAAQFPPLTPEQIRIARAVFRPTFADMRAGHEAAFRTTVRGFG